MYLSLSRPHLENISRHEMEKLIASWKVELSNRRFRFEVILSIVALVATLGLFTRFLGWVEQRAGATLSDPILQFVSPRDFTWLTFKLIYIAVVAAVMTLIARPKDLLLAMQSYTVMVWMRTAMMYLVPLEPSEGLIVLQDPLVQFFGNGDAPTKDLFFSGHTSTMFLFFLVTRTRRLKGMFLACTILVATFVVWQHVHYVIDVAVAPFVAYGSYQMAKGWRLLDA